MRHLAILAALALGGCAAAGAPRIETRVVEVPTAVACRPDLGPPPDYPDADAALKGASDLFERVKRLAAGRLLRIRREAELTAALKACAG